MSAEPVNSAAIGDLALTIDDVVGKTPDLPAVSGFALKIIQATRESDTSANAVAECLSHDQALSARVLRLANSAFYGLPRKVGSLNETVVLLGMRAVRDLALVAASYPWLSRALRGYALGPFELWRHSYAVAVGARQLSDVSGSKAADEALVAGLLQDIGKVALSTWLEGRLGAVIEYASRENITFDEAERRCIGFDHAEVGAHLARSWNLPEDLCSAIHFHHRPSDCESPTPLLDCVHIADYLATTMGFGVGADGLRFAFDHHALVRLGIDANQLPGIADKYLDACRDYETLLGELVAN